MLSTPFLYPEELFLSEVILFFYITLFKMAITK